MSKINDIYQRIDPLIAGWMNRRGHFSFAAADAGDHAPACSVAAGLFHEISFRPEHGRAVYYQEPDSD